MSMSLTEKELEEALSKSSDSETKDVIVTAESEIRNPKNWWQMKKWKVLSGIWMKDKHCRHSETPNPRQNAIQGYSKNSNVP